MTNINFQSNEPEELFDRSFDARHSFLCESQFLGCFLEDECTFLPACAAGLIDLTRKTASIKYCEYVHLLLTRQKEGCGHKEPVWPTGVTGEPYKTQQALNLELSFLQDSLPDLDTVAHSLIQTFKTLTHNKENVGK